MVANNISSNTPRTVYPNIPAVLTSFIGRKLEMAEVKQLLATSRLVTLTGAAGCGKTRLALRIAAEVSGQYADGVHWVELAPLVDAGLVSHAVAKAVNIAQQPDRPLPDVLRAFLRSKQVLLVLDNCEHLLSACAQLAESLLALPGVTILATSREALGVSGELRYPVSPMALPPANLPVEELAQFDAIELFVERARATIPHFELTAENAAEVTAICRHLDGIPLAIELASARTNVLTVAQIAARLDDRFVLLATAPHLTHSRHRTLRAAIEWSHDLLLIPEQVMLRRLSVFVAGWSLPAAEVVCAGGDVEHGQVLELLSSLVNKSLVVAETLSRPQARYHLLETIREFGLEEMSKAGETRLLRDRHLELFVSQAEEIEPKLRGPYHQLWMNWLEGELDNLRAALGWSLESGRVDAGLRLANAISEFWWFHGYQREGRAWFERLLSEATDDVPVQLRAAANSIVTHFSWQMSDHAASIAQAEAAIAMAEQLGIEGMFIRAFSLVSLANNLRATGEYEAAFEVGQQAILLARELGYGLAEPLAIQGVNAMALGKTELGRRLLDEAISLTREQGNTHRLAGTLKTYADLARSEGAYAEARSLYEQSLSIYRELNATSDAAGVLCSLAHTHIQLGEIERAHALLNESLALHRAGGNERGMAECLLGFGALAMVSGFAGHAVRLLTVAVTWAAESILNSYPGERLVYEKSLAAAQRALTEEAFLEAQREGRGLTIEQGMELALSMPLAATLALPGDQRQPGELTSRERQVAGLIARGLSNGQIADELVLSKRTVEKHIANILSKLGFTNRTQIVRWVIENEQASLG